MWTLKVSESGLRLDKFIAQELPDLSRMQVQRLIESGYVTVRGMVVSTTSYKVKEADEIIVTPLEVKPMTTVTPTLMDLDILYEDEHILVLNKPAGLVVHPAPGHIDDTLVSGLLAHCGESLSGVGGIYKPGIVHRLDKDTSGLMVIAKTDRAHQHLSQQFETRTLKREYIAYVLGLPLPHEGTIMGAIGRDHKNRQRMTLVRSGGKSATTHYEVMETFVPQKGTEVFASKILCRLETGRTHQIRVHLTAKGHPLLGDPVYGQAQNHPVMKRLMGETDELLWKNDRQALHAHSLRLIHPHTEEALVFHQEIPQDLEDLNTLLTSYL